MRVVDSLKGVVIEVQGVKFDILVEGTLKISFYSNHLDHRMYDLRLIEGVDWEIDSLRSFVVKNFAETWVGSYAKSICQDSILDEVRAYVKEFFKQCEKEGG